MTPDRTILHVDMDAFFVSVELLRRPELRGRPVVVGGSGARGVVAAASYEARSYGIHSAMPAVRARRLCPDAVFLPGDHPHYSAVSARLMEQFATVTPLVEPLSLDEAFLDITGTSRRLGPPERVAHDLRSAVREALSLSCSIGVASNKFLAKLATNRAKPRAARSGPVEGAGVYLVEAGSELDFLHPLPVGDLWGVGPKTLQKLERLGIATVGDLARTPPAALRASLGSGAAAHLGALAQGIDDREVIADRAPKSISHEETFSVDLTTFDQLRPELVRMSDAVASRLRRRRLKGRTVQLKIRYGDFTTLTRSMTLDEPTDRGTELLDAGWTLLERVGIGRGVRLVGIGVNNLVEVASGEQMVLELASTGTGGAEVPPARGQTWDAANQAVDAVRGRFGDSLIKPARLAGRGERSASAQWGPDGAADRDGKSGTDRSGRGSSG